MGKRQRKFNSKVSAMRKNDQRTTCIEMHCELASYEHRYGANYGQLGKCSWALRMGTVVPRNELRGNKNQT
jgi:hypothetical protein